MRLPLFLTLCAGRALAGTVVTLGTIKPFTGPADPALDLTGQFDYAVNFSPDDPVRTVNGLAFKPDTQSIPGASFTGPRNVIGWQAKPEYGTGSDANALEEIMHDIRWALSPGEKLQATLAVTPGIPYKIQILISGNNAETRIWDIRINGQPAVDEITSLGAAPGSTYAGNRSIVWAWEFVPQTSPVVVEMGQLFGGNDGGDRNPIWQALTLERIYIPPAPDAITLTPQQFFPAQTAFIGNFAVSDGKFGATHTLSLVPGTGSADNARFSINGGQLLPAFPFTGQPPGTDYTIRVRASDAADGTRFLEKPFTVSLAAPVAPAAVGLNAASLSRGMTAGQLAAVISATDANAFDRHVFALVPGTGSGDNALFTVSGNELRLAAPLPDGTSGISIRLRATDLSGLSVESVLTLPVIEPQLRINEVLPVSTPETRPLDENGQPQDWIELYNEQAQPVSLEGWKLSDDPDVPDKWTFPAGAVIAPNGYFLVFASGSGATPAGRPPHTSFSLSQSGEPLLLTRPDGRVMSLLKLPEMYPATAWGVHGAGPETGYLRTPTPGAPNALPAAAGRNEVIFSVPHGFKPAAFPLSLSATLPGSVIHYTLDGSVPTAASPVYTAPVTVAPAAGTVKSGTRIVRAVAMHEAAAAAPVSTQTYLFVNGITAPATDGIVGQSSFTAAIRSHPVYGPLMDDALLALPAVSLVINGATDLPYAETESSMELFDPAGGEPGFTIPAGIMRSGTTSLGYAKGSMSARFRSTYGAAKLKYPVYGRHPHDAAGAVTEFQELRLRSGSHDTHSWLGTAENPPLPYGSPPVTRSGDAQYIRNLWIEDMQLLMGQPGKHGRMVNLFVNGNYYGMYHIQEHADDDYMGSYFPGTAEDYHFTGAATTGSTRGTESWSTVWAQLKASLSDYTAAKRWVDVTSLADYMILTFYAGNDWDWSTQHNWGAAGPRLPDRGGWKFFSQDQDISLQDVNADATDQAAPDNIFSALMAHADFNILFRDRVYRHFFHDGVLTPAKAAGYYNLRAGEITTAIVAETARWQPSSSVGPLPWDRDGEWTVEKNYLLNTYFPQRTGIQLTQFRNRGWYPLEAPEMSQHGGAVPPGTQIMLTGPAAAAIYYTLDGSDPRLPGGAVSPAALAYSGAVSTRTLVQAYDDVPGSGAVWKYLISAAYPGDTWKTPAFEDTAWPQGAAELGYGDGDEVTNVGSIDIDPAAAGIQRPLTSYFRHAFEVADAGAVTGLTVRVKRDDGAVVYLNGQEIFRTALPAGAVGFTTPGNGGVNVPDDGNTWFTQTLTPGQYSLHTGTNLIAVEVHNALATSGDISFDLGLTASVAAASRPVFINGPATVRARAKAGNEWSAVHEASFYLTGTQAASTGNLTLTEIHYHPEGAGQDDAEFLEFTCTGDSAVDLTGVQTGGAVQFTFPPGIVLMPGERVTVVKDAALFDARYRQAASPWYHPGIRVAGVYSGSLSNSGEEIGVFAASGEPLYRFLYGDGGPWPGRADGGGSSLELSHPEAAPSTRPEKEAWLGSAASWRPSAEFHGSPGYAGSGPDNRVLISEVLSASIAPAVDFIELINPGNTPQSIGGWFLSDSSGNYRKFRIPRDTGLAGGAWLVFDESRFNNPGNPDCLVPFSLNSAGDDVFLLEADPEGNLLRFVDRVEFPEAPGAIPYGRTGGGTGGVSPLRTPTPGAANAAALPQYTAWVSSAFPAGTPPGDTAFNADPDHDGLDNLSEFAFKQPPLIPGGTPVSVLPGSGDGLLHCRFALRNDTPDLTASVGISPDMVTWDHTESRVERLPETPREDGMTEAVIRLKPLPAAPRTFLRLTVRL